MRRVAILHTTPVTVDLIATVADEELPGVQLQHLLDDRMLADLREAQGRPEAALGRRVMLLLRIAQEARADAALSACSSIGELVEACRPFVGMPVLRIDEPMAREAVARGQRIGVVATVATTLDPTVRLIERAAAREGRAIGVVPALCREAFEALCRGDAQEHDRLLVQHVRGLTGVDVVVLAQASMARVAPALADLPVPVLTSPRLGLRQLRGLLLGG